MLKEHIGELRISAESNLEPTNDLFSHVIRLIGSI